jgi:uncharacterized membrane protein
MPPNTPPPAPETSPPPAASARIGARIRNYFLTGVIVAGPLAITAYLVLWFIDTVDGWVKHIVPVSYWPDNRLPFHLPGLGVIFAFITLTLLGFLAANLAGRSLISLGEAILSRMPVIRSIYKSVKQIFETVFSQSGTSFRRVGLIEYPSKGMWSLVFISAPPGAAVAEHLPADVPYTSVFLPCTPNPTTGFYIFVPIHDVYEVPISPDEAVKMIMSCGVIQPDGPAGLGAVPLVTRKPAEHAA